MKELPIIFSGDSIPKIIDGWKIMTRRVVNFKILSKIKNGRLFYSTTFKSWAIEDFGNNPEADITLVKCPYDADQLWVRETIYEDVIGSESFVKYSDGTTLNKNWHTTKSYCPSIFMPYWASRIKLKVKHIKVERVQDISDDDCEKEGVEFTGDTSRKDLFKTTWNSKNEKRDYGWDKNPWVWVIEFEVMK